MSNQQVKLFDLPEYKQFTDIYSYPSFNEFEAKPTALPNGTTILILFSKNIKSYLRQIATVAYGFFQLKDDKKISQKAILLIRQRVSSAIEVINLLLHDGKIFFEGDDKVMRSFLTNLRVDFEELVNIKNEEIFWEKISYLLRILLKL